jgi:hypothetical protein
VFARMTSAQGTHKGEVMGRTQRLRAMLLGIMAVVLGALVLAPPPSALRASSHRDAPLITEDPTADNTDVYAWVDPSRPEFVTIVSNWIPFEEPTEGPNFYRFSDQVLYKISIVVNRNGHLGRALDYVFRFHTQVVNGNTYQYNTGLIGVPAASPSAQYPHLNVQQSFTMTEVRREQDEGSAERTVLLRNARTAPINVGPNSTGACSQVSVLLRGSPHLVESCPYYVGLANAAILTIPGRDGARVFAGPRSEQFYVDLMAAFDRLGGLTNEVRNPGVNSTKGFNVHSIALEIPMALLDELGAEGIIGVWSSSSRRSVRVLGGDDDAGGDGSRWVQVSRLGFPLDNEVLQPLKAKDRFNATTPLEDEDQVANFIVNPDQTQGSESLVDRLRTVTGCTALNNRVDLQAIILTGIPAGVLPGLNNFTGPQRADLLRLNYTTPPAKGVDPNDPQGHQLGILVGDNAGFTNGRRPFDDTVDIALKAVGGAAQGLVGLAPCAAAAGLTDNVDGPDTPFLTTFPYLGTPLSGFGKK